MQAGVKEILPIKRIRKDGSLDSETVLRIASILRGGNLVAMPVDSVFGLICICCSETERLMDSLFAERDEDVVRMVSSYRMLYDIAEIDKAEYDFLRRVWPGEVIVRLRKKNNPGSGSTIPVRFPRNKFVQDIIAETERPLLFGSTLKFRKKRPFKRTDVFDKYHKADLIVCIEEFLKKHPFPTVVDVSGGDLDILSEGRISAEEIKSLYFL